MDKAISLYSCDLVSIDKLITIDKNNKSSLLNYGKNQYVCPECYKPLFPKSLNSSYSKPHFSHYEKGIYDPDCQERKKPIKRNKTKKYLQSNKNIAKEIFQDIYIKSSIIYIKKSVISFINKKTNQNYKDFFIKTKNIKNQIQFIANKPDQDDFNLSFIDIENLILKNNLGRLAKQIFKNSKNEYKSNISSQNLCYRISSSLIDDIRNSKDKIEDNYIEEIKDEIFLTISLTNGFNLLQSFIIYGALITTLINYSSRSINNQVDNVFIIELDSLLRSIPLNIKESIFTLLSILPESNSHLQYPESELEKISSNNKILTSVKERIFWFLKLIEFDDIHLSDIDSLNEKESDNKDKGYIYLASNSDLKTIYKHPDAVKLGRSINPIKREIQLTGQLFNNPVKIKYIWRVSNRFLAERVLFNELSKYRIKKTKEIFFIPESKSKELITKILENNNLLLDQ